MLGVHLLGVERVLVVPHTRCAMASSTEHELRRAVGAVRRPGRLLAALPRHRGPDRHPGGGRRKVRSHPLIPSGQGRRLPLRRRHRPARPEDLSTASDGGSAGDRPQSRTPPQPLSSRRRSHPPRGGLARTRGRDRRVPSSPGRCGRGTAWHRASSTPSSSEMRLGPRGRKNGSPDQMSGANHQRSRVRSERWLAISEGDHAVHASTDGVASSPGRLTVRTRGHEGERRLARVAELVRRLWTAVRRTSAEQMESTWLASASFRERLQQQFPLPWPVNYATR